MSAATQRRFENELKRVIPLNTLGEDEFASVLETAEFVSVPRGEFIIKHGDTDSYNIYLLKGTLTLSGKGNDTDTISAHESSARFPIAHQIPRKYSVRANTKAEIVKIDNRRLGELLLKKGDTSYRVEDFDSSTKDDWMSQLLRLPAFQQIPATNMQSVMMRMEEVNVEKGDMVIREGDEGDYFYMIHQGRCEISKRFLGDEPEPVAELGPGDSFGEEALLSNKPRGSSVAMLTDGVLVRLSKEDFLQFVKHPVAKAISPSEARARIREGAVWLDVRSRESYEKSHLPDSINLPLAALRYQASSLDPETTYIVCCDDGQISNTAAFLLRERGFDALVLSGGLLALSRAEGSEKPSDEPVVEPADRGPTPDDVSAAIEELKNALSTSNASLKSLKQENLDYRGEQKRLRRLINTLQQELETTRHEAEEFLSQKNRNYEEKIQLLEREKGEFTERLTESVLQVEQLQEKISKKNIDSKEKKNAQLERLSDIEGQLAEERQRNDSLAAQLAVIGQQTREKEEEFEKALEQSNEERNKLGERLTSREAERNSFQTERDSLVDRVKDLEQQLEETRKAGETALQQETDRLRDELEQARSQNAHLTKQLDKKASEAGSALEQARTEIARLQSVLEGNESELETLSTTLDKRMEELATLGHTTESLRMDNDRESSALASANEQIQLITGERDEKDRQIQILQSALTEIQTSSEAADKELERLKESNARREAEATEKERQYILLVAEHEQAEASLKEENTQLHHAQDGLLEQLKARESQSEALDRRIKELETLHAEESIAHNELKSQLQSELEKASNSSRELEGKSTELQTSLASANSELLSAKGRIKELESELEESRGNVDERERARIREIDGLKADLVQREETLESERQASARQLVQLEESLQEEISSLREKERMHDETLASREHEIGMLRERLAEAEERHKTRTEELTQALTDQESRQLALEREHEEAISALHSAPESAHSTDNSREEEIAGSHAEIARLQSHISDLESDAVHLRSIIAELRQQNQELTAGMESEEAAALKSELQLIRSQAETEAGNLENQLKELRRALTEARENAESFVGEIGSLKESLAARERELARSREKVKMAENLAEEKEKAIVTREGAIKSLQSQIIQLQRTSDQRQKDQRTELKELSQSIEKSEARIRLLEKSLEQSEKARAQSEKQTGLLQVRLTNQQAKSWTPQTPTAPESKRPWGAAILGLLSGALAGVLATMLLFPDIEPTVWLKAQFDKVTTPAGEPVSATAVTPDPPKDQEVNTAVTGMPIPTGAVETIARGTNARPAEPVKPVRDRLRNGRYGPEMIEIPAGEFMMGNSRSLLTPEEQPEHKVTVGNFYIGRHEVTFDDYAIFASATGRRLPDDNGWGRGEHPVINVKWSDAVAYAAWISSQSGKKYRLPSEAEWEYAARGGTDTAYWWGYEENGNRANCFNCGSRWDGSSTAPVGSFPPNPFGVHDTAGNVMEWVSDCFHENYKGAPENGQPWVESRCKQRMIRGGAFNKPATAMKTTKRVWNEESATFSNLGFRLVREIE